MDADYAALDEALDRLAGFGPDLRNGLTNHAPMVAEACCALGRPEAVMPWIEHYRGQMLPWPAPRERIARDNWRGALAQVERVADWRAFFREELREASWTVVLNQWVGRLAPGLCASAAHGAIRVGHAARALGQSESPPRLHELADAFASWAYAYQELPTREGVYAEPTPPRDAIARVAVVPPERRRFSGTIIASLAALDDFAEFAPVIGLADVSGNAERRVQELAEVFAGVFLANTRDILTAIVFVHGVTGVAAVANMLPYLDEPTGHAALRYAWQTGCGLYAAFGGVPAPPADSRVPGVGAGEIVDRAIAHGDEHAIKFTEACLRFDARAPAPAYRSAALRALDVLPAA